MAAVWLAMVVCPWAVGLVGAAEPGAESRRCVVLDVFAREDDAAEDRIVAAAEAFAKERRGIVVVRRLIASNPEDRAAFEKLCAAHGFAADKTPVLHACGRVATDADDPAVIGKRVKELLHGIRRSGW